MLRRVQLHRGRVEALVQPAAGRKHGRGLRACKRAKANVPPELALLDPSTDLQQQLQHPVVHLAHAPPCSFGLYTAAMFVVLASLVTGRRVRRVGGWVGGGGGGGAATQSGSIRMHDSSSSTHHQQQHGHALFRSDGGGRRSTGERVV